MYDSQSGTEFNFRGIASGSNSLGVALDNTNHTVLLTLDLTLIVNDLPQATTTQRGVGETATNAETIAKASTTVFLTPSNLAAIPASPTLAGLVELATDAEAIAGVSTTLAITPANLAAVNASNLQTTTFADSVARAAAVPTFEGQFGAQLDTNTAWLATGSGAGDWDSLLTFGVGNEASGNTSVAMSGFSLTLVGNGTLALSTVILACDGADSSFNNATTRFGSTGPQNVDFDTQSFLYIGGGIVPAASIISTAGAGVLQSIAIDQFLSTDNTDTGWTNFSNSMVRKTGDCNTITLPQLAQVVDTLIQTLGTSRLLPIP